MKNKLLILCPCILYIYYIYFINGILNQEIIKSAFYSPLLFNYFTIVLNSTIFKDYGYKTENKFLEYYFFLFVILSLSFTCFSLFVIDKFSIEMAIQVFQFLVIQFFQTFSIYICLKKFKIIDKDSFVWMIIIIYYCIYFYSYSYGGSFLTLSLYKFYLFEYSLKVEIIYYGAVLIIISCLFLFLKRGKQYD